MGQTEGERASVDGEARKSNINSSTTVVVAPSLPPELISNILSRLPIEDVMRHRIVCKGWYALTKDRHFIQAHLSRSLCLPHRILLASKEHGPKTSLYLVEKDGGGMCRGREIPIENIPGNYMFTMCSCQGLLCVASSHSELDPFFIYNPITRECMELPTTDFESEKGDISVGFGFDPSSKKYKVVRLFKVYCGDDRRFIMKGQIITLGEGSWRELEKVSHIVKCCCLNAKPVFLDGALHWIIDRASHPGCEQILSLDLSDEKFRTIKFPLSIIESIKHPKKLGLYNLGGSLSLVEHIEGAFRLWRVEKTNTKKGYKFYKSSYIMFGKSKGRICGITLLDRLIDNSFLFHMVLPYFQMISGEEFREENSKKDELMLYFPEKEEYKVVELLGVPKFVHPNLFIPSLVSPGAQKVNSS